VFGRSTSLTLNQGSRSGSDLASLTEVMQPMTPMALGTVVGGLCTTWNPQLLGSLKPPGFGFNP
jgi:hypothetical protein